MISAYYQNVRGLRTKTATFYRNICLSSYDIICITESWLINGVNNSELFDDRYIIFRRDRNYGVTNQGKGGGVLLAVRRELAAEYRSEWSSSAEDLWVTLTIRTRNPRSMYKMHICVIYVCNENMGNSMELQLSNFADKLTSIVLENPLDKFIIIGDFNMPLISWTPSGDCISLTPSNLQGSHQFNFIDTINTCNLLQYNSLFNTSHGRLLDLVFSNSDVSVRACDFPLVTEDHHHPAVVTDVDFVQLHAIQPQSYIKYLYHDGNYDQICAKLDAVDWETELKAGSVDDALRFTYTTIYTLRDTFIPSKTIVPSRKYPLWYKRPLIKILREKAKYHKKFKTYGNSHDWDSFVILRERARSMEKEMYNLYISSVEKLIKSSPRAFWTYVKSKNSSNTYPSVMQYGVRSSDQGNEISNMFAEYFHSTFLHSSPDQVQPDDNISEQLLSCADIGMIEVLEEEVYRLIKTLDLNKSAGPDNVPAIFIIMCAKSLVCPLTILFRRSLTEGIVPGIWKSAYVTPIHKKGPKNIVENYRPISKLCLFAKVLEKIVYSQVYSALRQELMPQQHGFLRGRSTSSNLLLCCEYLSKIMAEPSQVDIIYTDYSKCFDRIDHLVLFRKLQQVGIRGNLFRWFTSYVHNRCQTVVLSGYASSSMFIPSGVPQGSILGPLLFAIFVNDVSSCFPHSKILLYADDMKILKKIQSLSDAQCLQEDLLRFQDYCTLNKLNLNVTKCFVCSFTRKPTAIQYDYTLHDTPLTRIDTIRDLGVSFDGKLLFDTHIDNIVTRASRALGFVLRMSAEFSDLKIIKILYCAFVRSLLEYASQVWNPCYEVYTSRLEGIQKRFLRYLQYRAKIFLPDYLTRCRKFHFLPLYERRNIADLSYLCSIANGTVDCPELLELVGLRTSRALRNPNTLYVPRVRTNYRQNAFIIRACNSFNLLTKENDEIDVFNTAVSKLKRILNDKFFVGSN